MPDQSLVLNNNVAAIENDLAPDLSLLSTLDSQSVIINQNIAIEPDHASEISAPSTCTNQDVPVPFNYTNTQIIQKSL